MNSVDGCEGGAFSGVAGAAAHSRLVQRLRRRYADELALLPAGAPDAAAMETALAALQGRGLELGAALRVLRQLVVERLVVLDCEQGAPLAVVTGAMTQLATLALRHALDATLGELRARCGAPLGEDGQEAALLCVGMGKLGAGELNVSSDIDLIYVYDADGESSGRADGRGRISVQEYFARAVRRITALLAEVTEHGFVFRVDLALRPNGSAGAPAISLDALEEYLLVQGREWERFAWLKSRVIAPQAALENGSAQALRAVARPFVYRRYLDYNVFEALRALHRRIIAHAALVIREGGVDNLKLGRGGIRDIEFTVQLLQVVRGGQFPELRCRATLDALPRLAQAGLMPAETAERLASAYTFLRRVEHRVQYLDDQQTHTLPTDAADLEWLAATMGCGSTSQFLEELQAHRACVSAEFDRLLDVSDGGTAMPASGAGAGDWDDMLAALPPAVRQRLEGWQDNPRFAALREAGRERLRQLLQSVADMLRDGQCSEEAALRLTDWLEPLLRRESYIALLLERPAVLARLLRVLGAARWPARYLLRHPGVIDELANAAWLDERFAPARFERALEERRAALAASDEDDEENLLNLLRRAHHAEVFRTLVRDIEGRISVEQVADDLSALADSILRLVARWSWSTLRRRHCDEPRLGIIAYGKLGGKELGYGSDLDLVFVFDDDNEEAPAVYGTYVRRIIGWLTINTGEGTLFEIDTALRPNGNSGLLVSHFAAYADYQNNRGSNTAWTWEHQAMTRARMVPSTAPETSGAAEPPPAPDTLAARFAAVRDAVLCAPREHEALRREILAMRGKLRAAHPVKTGQFDVKHSPGGMIDTEFVTQYLVLAYSREHPELRPNLGNITLLQRAESLGLLPKNVGQDAAAAYRHLRRLQHHARLNEQGMQVPLAQVQQDAEAVQKLWGAVFGGQSPEAIPR